MILVAFITVRCDSIREYRAYEYRVADILADHGGRIERTVVVQSESGAATFREVHFVRFPDAEAFAAYREDARYLALSPIRQRVIENVEFLVGEAGPDYSGSPDASRPARFAG